jgi:hypothetical protein
MKTIKFALMTMALTAAMTFASVGNADGLFGDDGIDLIVGLTARYLLQDNSARIYQAGYPDRRDRNRGYHEGRDDRHRIGRRYGRGNDRGYRGRYERGFSQTPRREYGHNSYTSEPIRGGSSRRTRIIANPYANRVVTGITLTGIDNDFVHIKDVVSYPGRYLVSPLDFTLSAYEPPRYINTGHYIDYISVAAKRKEYFTVTFHYQ